jgi:RimJ/RimL family protein N-acetyltransferase
MQHFQIIPITEQYIEAFREAVGSVARERKYLSFLDAPSLEMTRAFVMENLQEDWPHFIAVIENKVVGWCDITSLNRPILAHAGELGIGVLAAYRAKGLTRIELTVREYNQPAIALYKKIGFQQEGLHRNAVRIDHVYENYLSMALLFD